MDNPTTVTNATEVKPVAPKIKEPESVYTIDELARNHKVLNASYAIVKTALKLAKKETVTLKEAQKIVNTFKNKEVK